MSDPALIGTVAAVCGVGIVSAASCLLAPVLRCRHRTATTTVLVFPSLAPDVDAAAVKGTTRSDLAARIACGDVDALEYALCPAERRTTPHALRADGSRRCWECHHITTGDNS